MNQSTRAYPVPPLPRRTTSPKSSNSGHWGEFQLATWAATTSASVEPVMNRNWSIWWEAMSARMPPDCARLKNHGGRDPRFRRCGPSPRVWTTLPMAPAFTSSPARTVAAFSKRSLKQTE